MLRHIVAAVASLLHQPGKATAKLNTKLTGVQPDITPAFYIPSSNQGSFEGAQKARRKNRRNKVIRRQRSA